MPVLSDTPQPPRPEADAYETSLQQQPDVGVPLTSAELASLQNSSNKSSWDAAVAAILESRGGKMPSDWRDLVTAAGLDTRSCLKW